MKALLISPSFRLSLGITVAMLALTASNHQLFDLLSLLSRSVAQGEIWRILTANFVHFGWAHTLMNAGALVLATLALLTEQSIKKYLLLLLTCCLAVGLGIFWLNPEYQPYAGLSGAIHGLVVAGFLLTPAYPLWIRVTGLFIVMGKLIQENLPGYTSTDLQLLIPAAVAVESHLYGAIAGAAFALSAIVIQQKKRKH